jgi:hypothetical protein
VLTGRVSDRRLAQLYRSAAGFVFPSTEEGLGLPPVEAMHAGCPTLLARSSSLVELVNDPVAFVDPEDEADLARGMTALLTDDALRARLGGLADQAARTWTWQAAARRTWQALEELPSPAASAGQDLPAPLPLDARGLPQLSVSPGPAVVGADGGRGAGLLPASPRRLDGAAAPLRTALAPVTALVLERGAAPPAALVAAGGVELPVVEPDQLALAVRHDPLPALRERLHGRALPPAYLDDLVAALHAPARWWLERPRPVWLLLGTSWTEAEVAPLRAGCDALGADLVWAGPAGAVLGDCVDAVAVESGALDPEQLLRARCRGADVAVLGGAEGPVGAWWDRLGAGPGAWQPLLERWAGAGRRTGWPWRRRA